MYKSDYGNISLREMNPVGFAQNYDFDADRIMQNWQRQNAIDNWENRYNRNAGMDKVVGAVETAMTASPYWWATLGFEGSRYLKTLPLPDYSTISWNPITGWESFGDADNPIAYWANNSSDESKAKGKNFAINMALAGLPWLGKVKKVAGNAKLTRQGYDKLMNIEREYAKEIVKRSPDMNKLQRLRDEHFYLKASNPLYTTDKNGNVVLYEFYHGSPHAGFSVFDVSKHNHTIGGASANSNRGIFLTNNYPLAVDYAEILQPNSFKEKLNYLLGRHKKLENTRVDKLGDTSHLFDEMKKKLGLDYKGVYPLYINGANRTMVNFGGRNWNQLPFTIPGYPQTTNGLVQSPFKKGYDTVGMFNLTDPFSKYFHKVNNVAVKSGNQLKLSDPITYNDYGNPIPLSLRDNFDNPDIRYDLDLSQPLNTKEASEYLNRCVNATNDDIINLERIAKSGSNKYTDLDLLHKYSPNDENDLTSLSVDEIKTLAKQEWYNIVYSKNYTARVDGNPIPFNTQKLSDRFDEIDKQPFTNFQFAKKQLKKFYKSNEYQNRLKNQGFDKDYRNWLTDNIISNIDKTERWHSVGDFLLHEDFKNPSDWILKYGADGTY